MKTIRTFLLVLLVCLLVCNVSSIAFAAGEKSGHITLTVAIPTTPTISVIPETLTLIVGEIDTLTAVVYPDEYEEYDVIWTSSDDTIAEVDSDGVVTGKKVGNVIITALLIPMESSQTVIADTCEVIVFAPMIDLPDTTDDSSLILWTVLLSLACTSMFILRKQEMN